MIRNLMYKISILIISMGLVLSIIGCTDQDVDDGLVYVHSWTAEGLGGHFFSGASMGPVSWYVVEGFGDFLRTIDHVYYTTAKSIEHTEDSRTIVTLRDDVYWQGYNEKFTANDVVAYYYLNTGTITKYLFDVFAINETQIEFVWNPEVEPTEEVKTLLLVTDRVATVPYFVFKEFADICIELNRNSPMATDFTDLPKFGRNISSEDSITLMQTYNGYRDFVPEYFPATGPYKIDAYNANEMILVKNQDWYNCDLVGFNSIRLINSVGDASLFSSMLIGGDIDLWLNTPSKPVIENILASNPNLVFYKVASPYSIGIKFNMQKSDSLWTDGIREAFQYIIDRDGIRKTASYYSTTSWTSMSGMNDSDLERWMSDEAYEYFQQNHKYSFNLVKANEMLKQAGWVKKGTQWYDQNNNQVQLILGYDGSNAATASIAEATVAQLNNFGIKASLKRASGYPEFYATAIQANSVYDLVVDNTAFNASYNYPSAAFTELYYSGVGATANIKYYLNETLVGFNNQTFKPSDYVDKLLSLKDDQLTEAIDNLVIGLTKENVGINIFQESSGGIYNMGKIGGLPFLEYAQTNRDIQYLPTGGTEDHIKMLYTILFYDHGAALYNGTLYPRES